MKKILKNKKIIFIIIAFVIVIIAAIIFALSFNKKKVKSGSELSGEQYSFSNEIVELKGNVKVTSDKLNEKHCVDDICISNLVINSADNDGRIEYTLTNNSSKTSGYLKLNINNSNIIISYSDLNVGESKEYKIMFHGKSFSNVKDYSVSIPSEEDLKKYK